ncbi:hypothetical protein AB9R81_21160 [Vibrio cyclitrophicus]|uniref:hypothetical protein n=1 Tax=Vibrio TaxID=662 RepID=UPI0013010A42
MPRTKREVPWVIVLRNVEAHRAGSIKQLKLSTEEQNEGINRAERERPSEEASTTEPLY